VENNKKLEDYIKNKRHVCWVLNPLVEEYSVDSTVAVYVLNPRSLFEKVPETVLDVQQRIRKEMPDTEFYRFGELSESGDPKSLNAGFLYASFQLVQFKHRFSAKNGWCLCRGCPKMNLEPTNLEARLS